MRAFSPADGFLDVKEGVDEMIKYLANEPSLGLFFVQQHAHASMPLLLDVRDKVVERVHEVTLHTEDIEDSISVVQSMSEYGLPIADEMIKGINKSLLIMSTSQPKRGYAFTYANSSRLVIKGDATVVAILWHVAVFEWRNIGRGTVVTTLAAVV